MGTKFKHKMLIIGLTGSIGMGKSAAAQILHKMGLPVYDADKVVHALLKKGGAAVKPVAKLFPDTLKHGGIDRKALGRAAFGNHVKLRQLERIIHPLIRSVERDFLKQARTNKARAAILEIPLLFEVGAEKRCDVTLCVTAPHTIQKQRVLSRPGMTPEKFHAIVAHQLPDREKRTRADYIVPTGTSLAHTEKHLRKILRKIDIGK